MTKIIEKFIKSLYPEYADLAMSTKTEKDCLADATSLIEQLREENAKLRKALLEIRNHLVDVQYYSVEQNRISSDTILEIIQRTLYEIIDARTAADKEPK